MGSQLTQLVCVGQNAENPGNRAAEEIYGYFQQLDKNSKGDQVVMSREMFNRCFDFMKEILDKDAYKENKSRSLSAPLVQILDDRSTTPSTMFVRQLKHEISEKYRIDTTLIDSIDAADPKTVLILVCNRSQYTSIKNAVDQSLKDVKHENLFKRMILIMLHVARQEKLPKLSSSSEVTNIKSNIGGVVDMGFNDGYIYPCNLNEEAFRNITKFIKEQCTMSSQMQSEADPKRKKLKRNYSDIKQEIVTEFSRQRVYMISHSTSNAEESFANIFQTELQKLGIEVDRRQSNEASRLDPGQILLCVCNITSRTESDIENAFDEKIGAVANRTILIMLHVVRKGKEPKTLTESKLVNSKVLEKYQSLVKIIDVAFDNENDMIYKCEMNDHAFEYFKNLDARVTCTKEMTF